MPRACVSPSNRAAKSFSKSTPSLSRILSQRALRPSSTSPEADRCRRPSGACPRLPGQRGELIRWTSLGLGAARRVADAKAKPRKSVKSQEGPSLDLRERQHCDNVHDRGRIDRESPAHPPPPADPRKPCGRSHSRSGRARSRARGRGSRGWRRRGLPPKPRRRHLRGTWPIRRPRWARSGFREGEVRKPYRRWKRAQRLTLRTRISCDAHPAAFLRGQMPIRHHFSDRVVCGVRDRRCRMRAFLVQSWQGNDESPTGAQFCGAQFQERLPVPSPLLEKGLTQGAFATESDDVAGNRSRDAAEPLGRISAPTQTHLSPRQRLLVKRTADGVRKDIGIAEDIPPLVVLDRGEKRTEIVCGQVGVRDRDGAARAETGPQNLDGQPHRAHRVPPLGSAIVGDDDRRHLRLERALPRPPAPKAPPRAPRPTPARPNWRCKRRGPP